MEFSLFRNMYSISCIDETQFVSLGLLLDFPLKMIKPPLFGSGSELMITSCLYQDLNSSVSSTQNLTLPEAGSRTLVPENE